MYTTIYTPLQKWQTRLLQLADGPTDGPLEATLHKVDLTLYPTGAALHDEERFVEYQALSYTWGKPVLSQSISIDGSEFFVTETLASFLQQYRQRRAARTVGIPLELHEEFLWVDQICIHQSDLGEKSNQVANMMAVYERASEVVAWLGPGNESDDRAMEQCFNTVRIDAEPNECPRELREFLARPWFRRMWVQQEAWAARNLTLWTGSASISWSQLNSAAQSCLLWYEREQALQVQRVEASEDTTKTHLSHIVKMKRDRPAALKDTPPRQEMLVLLSDRKICECSDPRDRIYALLGMGLGQGIVIDYTQSTEQVFISFARYVLDRSQTFRPLFDVNAVYGHSADLLIPSWVPDWRTVSLRDDKHPPAAHTAPSSDDLGGKRFEHGPSGTLIIQGIFVQSVRRGYDDVSRGYRGVSGFLSVDLHEDHNNPRFALTRTGCQSRQGDVVVLSSEFWFLLRPVVAITDDDDCTYYNFVGGIDNHQVWEFLDATARAPQEHGLFKTRKSRAEARDRNHEGLTTFHIK